MSDERTQAEQEVQRELLLNHEIEQRVGRLIETGAKAVLTLKPPPGDRTPMEESQFRNLLNVAIETSSVDVITNFIRYQIGRNDRVWGSVTGAFGPTLIRDIEAGEVLQAAKAIQASLQERFGDEHSQAVFEQAYLRLTRLYLGYAMRTFYYCKKREDARQEESKDNDTQREDAWENLYRWKEE